MADLNISNQLLCSNCKGESFRVYFNFVNDYNVQISGITLQCIECGEPRIMDVI